MSAFNTANWKNALASVYERAMRDPEYRTRCLSDARAAMQEVSDIELPADLKFQFLNSRSDITYWYLLPPSQSAAAGAAQSQEAGGTNDLMRWSLCTDPTG